MKTLPLMVATAVLSMAAFAQSGTTFTNGNGSCSTSNGGATYYCTAMQTYAPNGSFSGYLGIFFTLKPDGTYANGHVYRYDTGGNVIFTADNFSGSLVGKTISGSFSGANFSGHLDNETLDTKQGHCYKGTCSRVWYVSSGSGWYNLY
jgi:hypothetical protein